MRKVSRAGGWSEGSRSGLQRWRPALRRVSGLHNAEKQTKIKKPTSYVSTTFRKSSTTDSKAYSRVLQRVPTRGDDMISL